MSSVILGGGEPQTTLHFNKTGTGEIEGTIVLLPREIKIYIENKTYSKLWFMLYIYFVTPHLGREG